MIIIISLCLNIDRAKALFRRQDGVIEGIIHRPKTVIRVTSNFVTLKSRPRIERFRIGEIRVSFLFPFSFLFFLFLFLFFFFFFTFRYEHRNRPNCFNVHNTRARDPRAITSEAHPLRTSRPLRELLRFTCSKDGIKWDSISDGNGF